MAKFKSTAEQILALKRSKQTVVDGLKTLAGLKNRSADESDTDDADNGKWDADKDTQWKTMMDSIDDHDDRISKLEDIQSLEGKGDEVEPEDNATMHFENEFRGEPRFKSASTRRTFAEAVRTPVNDELGDKMARFIMGLHQTKMYGREAGLNFVEQRFNDHRVTRALSSLTQGAGGAMVPQDFYADIIELLRASTVVRSSNPMTIGGPNGNMTMARLASGATASYGVELASTAVSQESFDNIQFTASKLTALVPVSNSLIRRAAFGVEAIIREDLVLTVARREDLAFLLGAGGVGAGPVGFANLVTAGNTITAGSVASPGYQPALATLLSGLAALELGASRMIRPTWICSPLVKYFLAGLTDSVGASPFKDELMQANPTLLGYPFKTTIQLGTATNAGIIFLADFADVVIMDSYTPEVDVSVDGTWVTGGTTYSAFQNDSSLLRVILEHDFQMRHLQSLVMFNTTDWTPGSVTGTPNAAFTNVTGAAYTTQTANTTASSAPSANPSTTAGA
jgi:HK97 family phage major capsid protein